MRETRPTTLSPPDHPSSVSVPLCLCGPVPGHRIRSQFVTLCLAPSPAWLSPGFLGFRMSPSEEPGAPWWLGAPSGAANNTLPPSDGVFVNRAPFGLSHPACPASPCRALPCLPVASRN